MQPGHDGKRPNARASISLMAQAVPWVSMLTVLVAHPARAADTPADVIRAPVSMWERAFYKTLTYEAVATASDLLVLRALTGVTTALGATFLAVDVGTAAATYYTHEIAWERLGPPIEEQTATTAGAKAVMYRMVSMSRGYGLAYVYAGSASIATTYAITSAVVHTAIYLGNEWIWNKYRDFSVGLF